MMSGYRRFHFLSIERTTIVAVTCFMYGTKKPPAKPLHISISRGYILSDTKRTKTNKTHGTIWKIANNLRESGLNINPRFYHSIYGQVRLLSN